MPLAGNSSWSYFRKATSEAEVYWRSVNARRKTIANYDALASGATQQINKRMHFKESDEIRHDAVSNLELASRYKHNLIEMDTELEDITENF